MNNFLNFETMVTPRIMKVLYLVGTIIIVLASLGFGIVTGGGGIIAAFQTKSVGSIFVALLVAMMTMIAGLIYVVMFRVWCEVLMLLFKINENLQAMREK